MKWHDTCAVSWFFEKRKIEHFEHYVLEMCLGNLKCEPSCRRHCGVLTRGWCATMPPGLPCWFLFLTTAFWSPRWIPEASCPGQGGEPCDSVGSSGTSFGSFGQGCGAGACVWLRVACVCRLCCGAACVCVVLSWWRACVVRKVCVCVCVHENRNLTGTKNRNTSHDHHFQHK